MCVLDLCRCRPESGSPSGSLQRTDDQEVFRGQRSVQLQEHGGTDVFQLCSCKNCGQQSYCRMQVAAGPQALQELLQEAERASGGACDGSAFGCRSLQRTVSVKKTCS